ncbi:hypothetical protein N665_0015s0017 [Sinapis alba]|nr:hypothetical protein N665_0015s0017 [Sinapis alba]
MSGSSESPLVLVHRPPTLPYMDHHLSRNFRLLNAHASPDPLTVFLARHASSVTAFVNIGRLKIDAELLTHLPSLQLLVCTSRRGIAVTNAGDAFSDDMADCAVGLLISVLRRIPAGDRYVRSGKWAKPGEFQLGIKVSSQNHNSHYVPAAAL